MEAEGLPAVSGSESAVTVDPCPGLKLKWSAAHKAAIAQLAGGQGIVAVAGGFVGFAPDCAHQDLQAFAEAAALTRGHINEAEAAAAEAAAAEHATGQALARAAADAAAADAAAAAAGKGKGTPSASGPATPSAASAKAASKAASVAAVEDDPHPLSTVAHTMLETICMHHACEGMYVFDLGTATACMHAGEEMEIAVDARSGVRMLWPLPPADPEPIDPDALLDPESDSDSDDGEHVDGDNGVDVSGPVPLMWFDAFAWLARAAFRNVPWRGLAAAAT